MARLYLRAIAAMRRAGTELRRKVYPNRVLTHRMSRQKAEQEIDMMRVIAEVMAEMAETERLI